MFYNLPYGHDKAHRKALRQYSKCDNFGKVLSYEAENLHDVAFAKALLGHISSEFRSRVLHSAPTEITTVCVCRSTSISLAILGVTQLFYGVT